MKLFKSVFYVCLTVLMMTACAEQKATEKPVEEKKQTRIVQPKDTISVATFNEWKGRWARNASGYMDSSALTFFGVHDIDLDELLGSRPDSARFYIGLDSLSQHKFLPHIMLVGMKNGTENHNLILDYSTTCPPQCP